jgi:Fe-S oxidoreductase
MASYKAEMLFHAYRNRLRPRSHYTLGALPRWARLAARLPRVANAALATPWLADLGKRAAGVDQRRSLPRFAPATFRQLFARHTPTSGDPVLLWVDTFTNHFSPEVGMAAVQVLEAAGFSVRIPDPGLCCGLTWISTGQLDTARRILHRGIRALGPAARAGIPIVGLEPSCTAVFRSDAAELIADDDTVAVVAEATRTLAEVLTGRPRWNTPDLAGISALVQPHCHQHAVLGFDADRALLRRAGARVETVGGCCGLAGNFGVERGHYDVSVAVANQALLPAVEAADPDTVLLADGFSCRTQLAELADRRGRHLAELLAEHLDG